MRPASGKFDIKLKKYGFIFGFIMPCLVLLILSFVCHTEAFADEDSPCVVSLGDSYSSGEGNSPYYGNGAPVVRDSNPVWLAHRSKISWPGRLKVGDSKSLSEYANSTWYFCACSGAVASNVYATEKEKTGQSLFGEPSQTVNVPVQIKEALSSGASYGNVDYVTLTIGGNDMNFAGIISSLAIQNGFINRNYLKDKLNDVWGKYDEGQPKYPDAKQANLKDVTDESGFVHYKKLEISEAYKSIRKAFGNQAKIIVAGYPTLLDDSKYRKKIEKKNIWDLSSLLTQYGYDEPDNDMSIGFSDYEAYMVNENVIAFNAELEELVNSSDLGDIYFVSVEDEFRGHEAYTDEPYLNGIEWLHKRDDINYEDVSLIVSAASFHPNNGDDKENRGGLEAYREAVQDKIDELESTETVSTSGKAKYYNSDNNTESKNQSSEQATTTSKRDIAMVLDVSGSMAGDPLDATKNAANKFVNVALENGAQTALISYDDKAEVLSEFTTGEANLKSAINQLDDGGGTNMESGLSAANDLLKKELTGNQYIVLMSDGQPNDGKTGDELITYAESIRDPNEDGRDDVIIYALGFNEGTQGQALLREIASDGCYFSVQDTDDLEDFFGDIVDSINGIKSMYVRIACPVDVTVSLGDETLSSVGEDPKTRTSFGSLAFEEANSQNGATNDPVKVLRLHEGQSYDVSISGTGDGSMDYTIGFIDDEGIYSDFRTFTGINISNATEITTKAEVGNKTRLSVDEDGDGRVDKTYQAGANEEGQLVDNTWIARLIVAGFFIVILLISTIVLCRKIKKRMNYVDAKRKGM